MQLRATQSIFTAIPPIHLGAHLTGLRNRFGIAQRDVLAYLPSTINQQRYSNFERNKRIPNFDELAFIYRALALVGVRLTLQDRNLFLLLSRQQLEAKVTHKVQKTPYEWEQLRLELATIDHLLDVSLPEKTQGLLSSQVTRMETNHLVGREVWLEGVYGYIVGQGVKSLVLQGPPGSGKTSELHRIANHFQQRIPRYYVVLCQFPSREQEVLGEDVALELLLSEIADTLGEANAPMPLKSLQARIKYILTLLAQADRHTLLLVDNAEQILNIRGEMTPQWKYFYQQFVHVRHQAFLVLATREWHTEVTMEAQQNYHTMVPALTKEEGCLLLHRLGLQSVSSALLPQVVEAVGGIPQCLEWVAKLVHEPLLQSTWAAFDEEEDAASSFKKSTQEERILHLLEDPSLFGGPIAQRVVPLLQKVVERLSLDAARALYELALAPVPLGSPALKLLYRDPAPLQELRDASLLAAYHKRVQLLPMVAAQVLQRLSPEQISLGEGRLIYALQGWLEHGIATQEKGAVFTELVCLMLRQQRLLAASELVLYHGWLSSQTGQLLRLASLMQKILAKGHQGVSPETEVERESGAILLHYYLASYLGETIDGTERAMDYERVYLWIKDGHVQVEPLMLVHLVDHMMMKFLPAAQFECAQQLLHECFASLKEKLTDPELHATLLSKRAMLMSRWSGTLRLTHPEEAILQRKQSIAIYRQCLDLLQEAEQNVKAGTIRQDTIRKKQATILNNLAYQLNTTGQYEEALEAINECLEKKEAGFADRDSLAASYGEKALILAALGKFSEALKLDEVARQEIRRCAEAGDTMCQEEQWIYQVNQARLLLLLGQAEEAEHLLREAEPHIHERRQTYRVIAQETLQEIAQGREASTPHAFQVDWRWIGRYRELVAYDAYWWWAYAGPFNEEEQRTWKFLFQRDRDEATKDDLRELLTISREREIAAALAEHREPCLHYPAIDSDELIQRVDALQRLADEIQRDEPNCLVRQLYQGAVEDEVCFLQMIEATFQKKNHRFRELSEQLYPLPTEEEMSYALSRVTDVLVQGMEREDTRMLCSQVLHLLQDRCGITLQLQRASEHVSMGQPSPTTHSISVQGAKRFFEAILKQSGYIGWQVALDAQAGGPRVEAALRTLFLPSIPLSLDDIREYLSHELLGHVTRSVSGESSFLGLLSIGTKDYLSTEEGLADFHERQIAALHLRPFDDSGTWLGTLAIGLASGLKGPPQSFSSLFAFFDVFLLLYRLLWRNDEDRTTAEQRARRNALLRCLRTFRGVSDLSEPGICFTKDVVYLRGLFIIERAAMQDQTVLDRLAVGKISFALLPEMRELGLINTPLQALRNIAYRSDLDAYILSFEDASAA